jgi:uncharacterized membrane protein
LLCARACSLSAGRRFLAIAQWFSATPSPSRVYLSGTQRRSLHDKRQPQEHRQHRGTSDPSDADPVPDRVVTAFATDLAYWQTANAGWATASRWLLGVGVLMALLAALAGFTDFLGDRRIRDLSDAWQHVIGNLVAVVLALINWFIRYGAAPGVFPWGIWISLVTVLLLLFNGWKGWELVYRHHVGIADRRLR